MKKLALITITIYQAILVPFFRNVLGLQIVCRFSPTCSEFMKEMIKEHGFHKGMFKGLTQLRNCHPRGGVYGTTV